MNNEEQKKIKFPREIRWNDENESILRKWADKGLCFKTMHDRATKKYWCLNAWFAIPVIIISTLTGSGNFAQGSFKDSYKETLILIIASSNIFAAILSTIAQYIGVAGLYESHKFASLSWDKYSRSIQVELAKNRSERSDASTFIGKAQEDFNRLMEISPVFSNDIISWFNHLIDTGNFDESKKYACGPCCYEWFCFPCGCKGCHTSKCVSNSCCKDTCNIEYEEDSDDGVPGPSGKLDETIHKDRKTEKELIDHYMKTKQYQKAWRYLELPDILGRMRPTSVADPSTDPGRIIEEDKIIQVEDDEEIRKQSIPEKPGNKYRVINDDDIV
tara:strand:- start:29 stop:1018 length:990 start_codon:yes stop_codon:yes gene_type:complete